MQTFSFVIHPCIFDRATPLLTLKTARSRDAPLEPALYHHLLFWLHVLNLFTSTFLSFSRLFISWHAAVQLRAGTICPQCVSNYTPLQIKLVHNAVSAGVCTCRQLCCSSTFTIRFLLKLISAEFSFIFRSAKAELHLTIILTFLSFFLSFCNHLKEVEVSEAFVLLFSNSAPYPPSGLVVDE